VTASIFLVAEVMQRGGEEAIAQQQLDRIGGIRHQIGKMPGEIESGAKLPVVELIDAQPPRGAPSIVPVVEPLRQLQRRRPGGAGRPGATDAVGQRPGERRGKPHARALRRGRVVVEARQCALHPLAALAQPGNRGIRLEDPGGVGDGIAAALAHDGPVLVDAVVNRTELAMPPSITAEMAKSFTLYMVKAILNGRAEKIVDLAKTNLWR
jgi:hypothetical protein